LRSFVGNFVANFVDAIHVREKAVKLGKVSTKLGDEVLDEVTKGEKQALAEAQRNGSAR
jgi:hypothetical protein